MALTTLTLEGDQEICPHFHMVIFNDFAHFLQIGENLTLLVDLFSKFVPLSLRFVDVVAEFGD